MFRERSSGVGTPDSGEMKGRRPMLACQAFESTISVSSKICHGNRCSMQPSFGPKLNASPSIRQN